MILFGILLILFSMFMNSISSGMDGDSDVRHLVCGTRIARPPRPSAPTPALELVQTLYHRRRRVDRPWLCVREEVLVSSVI